MLTHRQKALRRFVVDNHPTSKEVESLLEGTEATIWFLEESTIASIATTVTPQPVISTFFNN